MAGCPSRGLQVAGALSAQVKIIVFAIYVNIWWPSKIECFTICSVAVLIIARLRNRKKLEKQEDWIKKLAYINARMFR